MKILLTICARGGSKGIPGKNIKMLAGKPLIQYTVDTARAWIASRADLDVDIVLSTDSDEIRDVAARCGLECDYRRPEWLADDVVSKVDAIKDVTLWAENVKGCKYDYVLDLDVTSPMRTLGDIDRVVAMAVEHPEALTVFTVSPCRRNPYFNQVECKPTGYYGVVKTGDFTSRQTSPRVYDINGSIYIYARAMMDREAPRAVTERTLVVEMDHPCFDLDEPEDYEYMAYLFERREAKDERREARCDSIKPD